MGFKLTTLVVIDTDYTGSCKFNYHTITTTTAPINFCIPNYKICLNLDLKKSFNPWIINQ